MGKKGAVITPCKLSLAACGWVPVFEVSLCFREGTRHIKTPLTSHAHKIWTRKANTGKLDLNPGFVGNSLVNFVPRPF